MKIAVFGATSQIAKDLIINLTLHSGYELTLFGRDLPKVETILARYCQKAQANILDYSCFHNDLDFDVIINFVGVGDPAKAKDIGQKIISITEEYDNKSLSYIKAHPACKYVFLSSGAAFGNDFSKPVNKDSKAVFDINHLASTDWYSIAKFCAEAKHRAMTNYNIIDIRVFNYFSATQNFESRFLMSDIVQSILQNTVLLTTSENITRDFINPIDFFQLFEKVINQKVCNQAIDAYTREPIDKLTLLEELKSRYGLRFEFVSTSEWVNATGHKSNYYSINRKAEDLGYFPKYSSLEGIVDQLEKLLINRAQSK